MAGRLLVGCLCLVLAACSESGGDRLLTHERLAKGNSVGQPVPMSEFAAVGAVTAPSHEFSGLLRLDTANQSNAFELLRDQLALLTSARPGHDELPTFAVAFVQDGDLLIPMEQGPIDTGHEWWDLVLRPGRVWTEHGDRGWSRAVIPFALKERREDCVHNGVMMFLFGDPGEVSHVAFQVSSQTCSYLQFEMHGMLAASYEHGSIANADVAISRVRNNLQSRVPTRDIARLADDYPGANAREFGSADEIAPADMSAYGFLIDGVHYAGGCNTPRGRYPLCDELALPSYSTAKSLVGGLGLMVMEARFPGTVNASIGRLVPECGETWDAVTIEHALDMTTGHYGNPAMHVDEDAAINSPFFNADTHAGKIEYACNAHPRQSVPGEVLTYHSWDTYLAGTALNARLRALDGAAADFYDDLIVEGLWEPLGLSQLARATRRTYDEMAQPFTGFGLTFVRDDVARLLQFLGPADGRIAGKEVVHRPLFDAVKQRVPGDPGKVAELETMYYNNGFRSFDVSSYLGCSDPVWVVVLSGFGGINFVVMPNDTAYYYFSDGGVHRYLHAVRESHRIRSMCVAPNENRAASR